MQTLYPNHDQIEAVRHRTGAFLQQNGNAVNPSLFQFTNLLMAIPGVAMEILPAPDNIFRIYCTEEANQHIMNIHLDMIARFKAMFGGNYDWYLPGACNLVCAYFLYPGKQGPVWFPVWEARVSAMDDPRTSTAVTRVWGDAITEYLRYNGFIR
ncbi:hypothetical protein pEaSNUABM54_00144 [Erwinia phage pEa_SNUABM_54]|nr:hypothetical protein pEaSNUABM54_00144 [Erwinia phage pEa_SNUABM_54]